MRHGQLLLQVECFPLLSSKWRRIDLAKVGSDNGSIRVIQSSLGKDDDELDRLGLDRGQGPWRGSTFQSHVEGGGRRELNGIERESEARQQAQAMTNTRFDPG